MFPHLYSFRRCPYAIRARLALGVAEVQYEHREILLRNKPEEMLLASPKGTVPVLVLSTTITLEESLEIMKWALSQNDPQSWRPSTATEKSRTADLIQENDGPFKMHLDRTKYSDRYPPEELSHHRKKAEEFLGRLKRELTDGFLVGGRWTLADAAIAPFIRQYRGIDIERFNRLPYPNLQSWLVDFLESQLFLEVMEKKPLWLPESTPS
ncbi:MAG: glutathione S-transferase [Polyangiaceae bacterium]|nr:glutathione S-transferase [Polyangiaceae bacterium]